MKIHQLYTYNELRNFTYIIELADKTAIVIDPWDSDEINVKLGELNLALKTIINTLADRLRKTNEKVKSLESNSVSLGAKGTQANYKFFTNSDIVRFLTLIYLALKTHKVVPSKQKTVWVAVSQHIKSVRM